jgi:hypothetical protein
MQKSSTILSSMNQSCAKLWVIRKNNVIVPVTTEIANERLGQLRYNLRVQVESYMISNQTVVEAEMKTKGLGETSQEDFSVLADWENTK